MSESYVEVREDGSVRLAGTLAYPEATVDDVLTVQADGSIAAAPGGGVLPDPITDPVTISPGADVLPLTVQPTDVMGTTQGTLAEFLSPDENEGILVQWGTAGLLLGAPASGAALEIDSHPFNQAMVLVDATGTVAISPADDGAAALTITPNGAAAAFDVTGKPEVPAIPTAQDVVDALVALGLVTQA